MLLGKNLSICCRKEKYVKHKDNERLKVKCRKNTSHWKTKKKKIDVTILIAGKKRNLSQIALLAIKISIHNDKRSIHQADIIILNLYMSTGIASIYTY